MSRYIDAEHLMQKLSRMIDFCEKHKVSGLNALFQVGDAIMDCPTADVVPRAEVDKIIHNLEQKRVNDIENTAKIMYRKTKAEVAEEIFAEIEKTTASVYNDFMFNREGVGINAHYVVQFSDELDIAIAELKKKYTEGEK